MSVGDRARRGVAQAWRSRRAYLRVAASTLNAIIADLGRCWFIFAVASLATAVLLFVPQGREALYSASEPARAAQAFILYAILILGAVQVTLFAALILSDQLNATLSAARRYAAYYVPALVGLAALFAIPVLLQKGILSEAGLADSRRDALVGLSWLLQMIGGILVPLSRNQKMMDALRDLGDGKEPHAASAAAVLLLFLLNAGVALFSRSFLASAIVLMIGVALIDLLTWRSAVQPKQSAARLGLGIAFALAFVGGGLYVAADPGSRAAILGPANVLVLSVQFWIGLGFLAAIVSRRLPQSIAVLVFVWAAISFATGPFNRAPIRTLPGPAPVNPDLVSYAEQWLKDRRVEIETYERYPVFIATADGGGIRAAYWTGAVLGALQDRDPAFVGHLFAISGVSGGSLGAAVFAAIVHESSLEGAPSCTGAAAGLGPFEGCASSVLAQDFLSPALTAMLIADTGRSITRTSWLPDRAQVLERSFERAWREAVGTDAFAQPFAQLWLQTAEQRRAPALFLNGTDPASGQRLVMSNVDMGSAQAGHGDLAALLAPRTVRLSTAVMMSARFPGISPVGVLESGNGPVRVVDGGYFDNSGAATGADILAALQQAANNLGLSGRIVPLVLMIANEPQPPQDIAASPEQAGQLEASPVGTVLAPVATLDKIRQGLAHRFKKELTRAAAAAGGEALDGFRVRADTVEFPLGWMLSDATRAAMHAQIAAALQDEDSDYAQVLRWLQLRPAQGVASNRTLRPEG